MKKQDLNIISSNYTKRILTTPPPRRVYIFIKIVATRYDIHCLNFFSINATFYWWLTNEILYYTYWFNPLTCTPWLICWLLSYLHTSGLLVIYRLRGIPEHRISGDYFELLQRGLGNHCRTHLWGNSPSPCGTTAVRLWPLSGGGLCAEWSLRGDRGTHGNVGCSRYKKQVHIHSCSRSKICTHILVQMKNKLISVQMKTFLTGERVYLISYFLDISVSTQNLLLFSVLPYTHTMYF